MKLSTSPKLGGPIRFIGLGKLEKGKKGLIIRVGNVGFSMEIVQRLMEMGFLEGTSVEVLHLSPFGGDPIVVRVRGSLIALR